ncbi:MAG: DMT family transporter [Peptococcaceae bacterium]
MNTKKGILYTLLSAGTFALTPLFIVKGYRAGASAWQMIFIQSIVASVILLLGLLIFAPRLLNVNGRELKILGPIGLIGSLGTVICYNLSLQYISGGVATLLLYTYPVLVTIGSVTWLKNKLTVRQFMALGGALGGVALATRILSLAGPELNAKGLTLGLMAALFYTVLNLLSEKALNSLSAWKVTAFAQFGAALGILGILFIKPDLIMFSEMKAVFWLYGGAVSVLCSIVPVYFLMKGISNIGSGKAAIISTAEIPLTLFLVFIFLDENFTLSQIAGSFLIFLSILLLKTEEGKSLA